MAVLFAWLLFMSVVIVILASVLLVRLEARKQG
jgi:hypothetical protein